MVVGGRNHAPAALPAGRDPIPILQEAEWAPGPVWTGAENLGPAGIRSPERPARSESLYRLTYPGPPTAKDERGTGESDVSVFQSFQTGCGAHQTCSVGTGV